MELSLKQRILNELDNAPRGYSEELAKLAGYSSGSALVKAMKKEEGDIEIFDGFVRLVHELFPEEKFKYMDQFARTLNPQRLTARFMLEYATLYKLKDLQYYLIRSLKSSSNKESNDWAFVYEMDEMVMKQEIGQFEAISQLVTRKYSSCEMKIYSKIVRFYCYYDMRNIHMMESLRNDIEHEIANVKKKFVRDSFYARLFLIDCSVALHNKNISVLREKLFMMESALDPLKSLAYLQIGNSYMFTNYDKAHGLYKKSFEFSTEQFKMEVKKSINFINILWDKFEGYIEDGDDSNKLFYYAKKGQFENGKKLLETIDVESLSDYRKGFNYYYQGLLFKDKTLFYKSIEHFNKCGEKFYKKLPILELQKAGESIYILNALSA